MKLILRKYFDRKKITWPTLKPFVAYSGSALLSLLIITWILKLWEADFSVPFTYHLDSIAVQSMLKGMVENGWWFSNPKIGAPTSLALMDYPNFDSFHLIIIKFISLSNKGSGFLLNAYFLLAYPLITLSAVYTFRRLNFSYGPAIVAGILYVFAPFHLFRAQGHLFLAAYYIIPLVFLVIYWTYLGEVNLFSNKSLKDKLSSKKNLLSLVIFIILGQSGIYYIFFSIVLFVAVGILASIQNRQSIIAKNVALLVLVTVFIAFLGVTPNILYKLKNGSNPSIAVRQSVESEIYGLRITQLVFPSTTHRTPILDAFKQRYNTTAPNVNENQDATLGFIASLGFLFLLAWVLLRDNSILNFLGDKERRLLNCLGALNLIALLLGTIGGFGSVIAYTITPQIRGYNRISIFIAFFSFTAVFLIIDNLYKKYANRRILKIIFYAILLFLLAFGVFDQTYKVIPQYDLVKSEYSNDKQFVKSIERVMPVNAMIFQLPYVAFPESPPVHNLLDYNLFRGYLHSKDLRWSYGAVKGRQGDAWQKQVSAKPPKQFIEEIKRIGFKGIYIDRFGFKDNAQALEKEFSSILKEKPLVSKNQRHSFFKLNKALSI